MVFKVTYSEKASDDLSDIIRYISYKLNSPQAAERFFTKVLQKIEWLRENPYLFPLYHDEKLSADGYRFVVIGNYLLFYVIDDSNSDNGSSIVNIVRIIYNRRNIPTIIDE